MEPTIACEVMAVEPCAPGEEDIDPDNGTIPFKHAVRAVEMREPPWATNILRYLRDKEHPADRKEAERVFRQAKMYTLIDGELY